jgi:hypothetical protein
MRKGFLVMLAVVLVAVLAAPAVAGTDINGFYRAKGYLSNFKTGATLGKDVPSQAYVEQRFRIKFSFGEENVKAVFFTENDIAAWGDSNYSTGTRNSGGALGGDSVSTEVKNAYLWFKVPNTSVNVTVGLQGVTDPYAGVFLYWGDMAGIFVSGKLDPVSYRLGWSKWFEQTTGKADDATFYLAEAKFSPSKDVQVGGNLYFIQDDRNRTTGSISRIYMPGVDATFGAGPVKINAFAFAQFGKFLDFSSSAEDVKITGFAADVRADLNAGPGKVFAEALYVSGGDEPGTTAGQKYKSIVTASNYAAGMGLFGRTDMQILLPNNDDINTFNALVGGLTTTQTNGGLGNGGRGVTHIAAGYTQKFGDKLSGKVGAGYLQATKLLKTDEVLGYKKKNMGTEVNASVNYNLMKGLDVGVVGAYAFIGDYFKTSSGSAGDPDNAYDLHARINYAF